MVPYKDYAFNAGYEDAVQGRAKWFGFEPTFKAAALEEYYQRGWDDGILDNDT